MRTGAAAVLAALLLSAPAQAEEPAAPPTPVETVKGECSHPDEAVTRWLQFVSRGGISSFRCKAATLDWERRITFYRDDQATKEMVAYIGHTGPDGRFVVTAIKRMLLPERPAKGLCQLLTPEGALEARRVMCFVGNGEEEEGITLTEMLVADREWPGTAAIPGRCSAPGIAPYVLAAWIMEQTAAQQEPVLVPQDMPACRSLTVVPGQSFAFAAAGESDGVTFLGSIEKERPELLTVKTIILPGGARQAAQAGACYPKREADGHVVVLCMAAYSQGGAARYVEVGFIPEGSRFEWPRDEEEKEPAP